METSPTNWTVTGMTCSNCALSVSKYLQQEGMEDVSVNPLDGKVSFENITGKNLEPIAHGIQALGYQVTEMQSHTAQKKRWLNNHRQRFLATLPFTAVLMLHMVHSWVPMHWLMNGWVQLLLCLPVFAIGMNYFGKSAWKSMQSGIPNMNVLVTLGAIVSFTYSLIGLMFFSDNHYLFFETTASIITLVFLGNYLEEHTMQSTQRALKKLASAQKVTANMIAFDDQHQEIIFEIDNDQLKSGDLVLIRTGEQVPADAKILWGSCSVNESILTGESLPVNKQQKDMLIGGSIVQEGAVKAQVTAAGKDTVLSGILRMVQQAQAEKPPMQKLADKISAIFVPMVIIISLFTFFANWMFFSTTAVEAMMRAIAVLVISCPCAMGLATPAAISVGLGRAANKGIIFRNAGSLEHFKDIRRIVFDKTGTITTGKFVINDVHCIIPELDFKKIVVSLEKHSNHPIAKSIVKQWGSSGTTRWRLVEEIKGVGVKGTDMDGNVYEVRSVDLLQQNKDTSGANVYVYRNGEEIGKIGMSDEIRPEATEVIQWLHNNNIETILLTGDKKNRALAVAEQLHIGQVHFEQSPEMKMNKIAVWSAEMPTAMVGDGINDAPALAKATLGISLSDASDLATQHADVILMNQGLKYLPEGLGLGKHTYLTIKQNLFWAFSYNIIAIPVAAMGFLTPAFAAMAMGFSDVMLGVISLWLYVKKVR